MASASLSSATPNLAFCQELPKIELHAHLTGSISRQCLHEIWEQRAKRVSDAAQQLQDPLIAIPAGKVDYDLQTFFPLFSSYIYKLCDDLSYIRYSTNSVLEDFANDNVVYLELRTTPRAIPANNITRDDYVSTVLDCLRTSNEDNSNPLHSALILSIDRRHSTDDADEIVNLAIKYCFRGVVGVDLCGNPEAGPIDKFAPAFAKAKEAGLKITLHFAEAPASSTDEELQTLVSWQPDRLGHVIHVNDRLKSEIIKQRVGVELCLSCNVHAKMITGGFGDHHLGWWRGAGVGVALSTDDVGVFCSPLSNEYYLAAKHFRLGKADVRELCDSAVEVIFSGEEEKQRLRQMYASWKNWER